VPEINLIPIERALGPVEWPLEFTGGERGRRHRLATRRGRATAKFARHVP
jgi:hypothetical protein